MPRYVPATRWSFRPIPPSPPVKRSRAALTTEHAIGQCLARRVVRQQLHAPTGGAG